jgi:hypothetical protein
LSPDRSISSIQREIERAEASSADKAYGRALPSPTLSFTYPAHPDAESGLIIVAGRRLFIERHPRRSSSDTLDEVQITGGFDALAAAPDSNGNLFVAAAGGADQPTTILSLTRRP